MKAGYPISFIQITDRSTNKRTMLSMRMLAFANYDVYKLSSVKYSRAYTYTSLCARGRDTARITSYGTNPRSRRVHISLKSTGVYKIYFDSSRAAPRKFHPLSLIRNAKRAHYTPGDFATIITYLRANDLNARSRRSRFFREGEKLL